MTTLTAAKKYASKGWAVIPVHSVTASNACSCGVLFDLIDNKTHGMGKLPYTEHRHKDASKDESQIDAWWSQFPDPNVAIATGAVSGFVVLDIDKKNEGLKSLDYLERRYGKLPTTPKVHSGGGGLHFYFKHPGIELRGRRGMLPGIDVQADGGAIVAPPSNHKLGTVYKWDDYQNEDSVPLAPLPHWLLRMIKHKIKIEKIPG